MGCEINNLTKKEIPLSFLKKAWSKIFHYLGLRDEIVSIVFINEKLMKKLNHQYRRVNQVTDVLSFSLKDDKNFIDESVSPKILGEIYICLPQALKQAKEQGHSFSQEATILFVHGLLHLLGFNHSKSHEQLIMRRKEAEVFKKIDSLFH